MYPTICPSIHTLTHSQALIIYSALTPVLVPLAGTVQRLLEVVVHNCGITRAVECNRAGLKSIFAAALAEPGVSVDVEVEYGGRRTFPITRVDSYL